MYLMIDLLSDLCTYSGEVYNSLVDIDVVHDQYGFPYIPAKRIKGCIREAYLELVEFDIFSRESFERIFGSEGCNQSAFTLGNAYLESYDDMKSDLVSFSGDPLIHPQNVLNLYTYVRTQTSLDFRTGSAHEGSLRNMRVVKSGTKFLAEIHFVKELTLEEKNSFYESVQMVKHMGVRRSRGLGLVQMTIDTHEDTKQNVETNDKFQSMQSCGRKLIPYRIYLNEPVCCKSAEGSQSKSSHYLEGGKLLGMIAGAMGNDKYLEMMKSQILGHELIVSNAYIECEDQRCLPLSASIQKLKDQAFDENHCMEVFDMLADVDMQEQFSPIGMEYVSPDNIVKNVETSIRYHHKRPNDKSVGRATGEDGSEFYQIESINKGQAFRGYILADPQQTKNILAALGETRNCRMGNDRNTEYGGIRLQIGEIRTVNKGRETRTNDFVLHLDSAVILMNNNGMYTADVEILRENVATILNCQDLMIKKCFLTYETIGGYNVTWKRRKPVYTVLGKGTVCLMHSETGVDISLLNNVFIGERVSEGYGEIHITEPPEEKIILKKVVKGESEKQKEKTDIIKKLKQNEVKKMLEKEAREKAKEHANSFCDKDGNAIIRRLLLVHKEQPTYKDMYEQVTQWSSEEKKQRALALMEDIKAILNDKSEQIEVAGIDRQEAYRIVSGEYFIQKKYQYRNGDKEVRVTDYE